MATYPVASHLYDSFSTDNDSLNRNLGNAAQRSVSRHSKSRKYPDKTSNNGRF